MKGIIVEISADGGNRSPALKDGKVIGCVYDWASKSEKTVKFMNEAGMRDLQLPLSRLNKLYLKVSAGEFYEIDYNQWKEIVEGNLVGEEVSAVKLWRNRSDESLLPDTNMVAMDPNKYDVIVKITSLNSRQTKYSDEDLEREKLYTELGTLQRIDAKTRREGKVTVDGEWVVIERRIDVLYEKGVKRGWLKND
jgi:hypothetical protein